MANREDFPTDSLYRAETACIYAAVSGSVGSTAREEARDCHGQLKGEPTFATVERVVYSKTSPACLWRVSAASDPAIVGVVLVQSAQPGRATSHAIENDFIEL